MYQLIKIVNDEETFRSRETENIKEVEHVLKVMASRGENIAIAEKSGQLVDVARKIVIWTPGERGVHYTDERDNFVEMRIILT